MLAGMEPVQKEIGLVGENLEKVRKVVQNFYDDANSESEKAGFTPDLPQKLQRLSPEDRAAKLNEMSEKRIAISKRLREKYLPQVKDALSPAQYERLQQINWQAKGSRAFLVDEELVRMLNITQEQREKIEATHQEFAKKRQEVPGRRAFPDSDAARERLEKLDALNKQCDAKVLELLIEEQQEEYARLDREAL